MTLNLGMATFMSTATVAPRTATASTMIQLMDKSVRDAMMMPPAARMGA